jgi:hypothetical protein
MKDDPSTSTFSLVPAVAAASASSRPSRTRSACRLFSPTSVARSPPNCPAPPNQRPPQSRTRSSVPLSTLPLTLAGASPAPGAAPPRPAAAQDDSGPEAIALPTLAFARLERGTAGRQAGLTPESTSWPPGSRGRRGACASYVLLRRLDLRDGGGVARDGRASHVARLALVVPSYAVHHLAVVPHDEVPLAPCVNIDEARLCRVLGEIP